MLRVLLALGLFSFSLSSFAGFSISPLKVELAPNEKSAVLTARNQGDKPLTIQVTPKLWRQLADGKEEYTKTNEVLAFPRQVTIAPNSKQTIRLGIRPKAGGAERNYRLFLEEIPDGKPGQAQLKFVLAMSLPIFVKPQAEIQTQAVLGETSLGNGHAMIEVANKGNHYFRVGEINLDYKNAQGESIGSNQQNGWYVLADSKKSFAVPVTSELCQSAKTIEYSVAYGEQTLNGSLAANSLGCIKPEPND